MSNQWCLLFKLRFHQNFHQDFRQNFFSIESSGPWTAELWYLPIGGTTAISWSSCCPALYVARKCEVFLQEVNGDFAPTNGFDISLTLIIVESNTRNFVCNIPCFSWCFSQQTLLHLDTIPIPQSVRRRVTRRFLPVAKHVNDLWSR